MDSAADRWFVLAPLAGVMAPDSLTRAVAGTALFLIVLHQVLTSRRTKARIRAAIAWALCVLVGVYLVACGANARGAAVTTSTTAEDQDGIEIAILDRSRRISLPPIVFERDSATLLDEARDDLRETAARLSTTETAVLQLTDHSASHAAKLGDQRVRAIADYLVGLGVEPTRIHSTRSREGVQ